MPVLLTDEMERLAVIERKVTASAFLVNRSGQLLLGCRAAWKPTWPGCWDTIGGRLELDETPEAALIREIEEELGVTPTHQTLLDSLPEMRPDLHGEALHHVFLVSAWTGGPPVNASDEHSEIRWFPVGEIDDLTPLAGAGIPRLARLAVLEAAKG